MKSEKKFSLLSPSLSPTDHYDASDTATDQKFSPETNKRQSFFGNNESIPLKLSKIGEVIKSEEKLNNNNVPFWEEEENNNKRSVFARNRQITAEKFLGKVGNGEDKRGSIKTDARKSILGDYSHLMGGKKLGARKSIFVDKRFVKKLNKF